MLFGPFPDFRLEKIENRFQIFSHRVTVGVTNIFKRLRNGGLQYVTLEVKLNFFSLHNSRDTIS